MYFRVPMFKQSDGTPSASFTAGIYCIRNTANGKVYFGSSVNVHDRLRAHRNYLLRGNHQNIHLQRAFEQYGSESFEFEFVEQVPVERLLMIEQQYLDRYWDDGQLCYNIAKNAEASARGARRSEETKRKISEAKKGNTNRLGIPNSVATRKKLSRALLGRKISAETRKKLSEVGKGRKASPESIAKRAKTYQFQQPNGECIQIKNLKQFCRDSGISFSGLLRVYHGHRISHKGWRKAI